MCSSDLCVEWWRSHHVAPPTFLSSPITGQLCMARSSPPSPSPGVPSFLSLGLNPPVPGSEAVTRRCVRSLIEQYLSRVQCCVMPAWEIPEISTECCEPRSSFLALLSHLHSPHHVHHPAMFHLFHFPNTTSFGKSQSDV